MISVTVILLYELETGLPLTMWVTVPRSSFFVDRTGNKNPVDEVKYEELCGRDTVSEVLDCPLVDVTGFPGFHLVVQNVVQLCSQY